MRAWCVTRRDIADDEFSQSHNPLRNCAQRNSILPCHYMYPGPIIHECSAAHLPITLWAQALEKINATSLASPWNLGKQTQSTLPLRDVITAVHMKQMIHADVYNNMKEFIANNSHYCCWWWGGADVSRSLCLATYFKLCAQLKAAK